MEGFDSVFGQDSEFDTLFADQEDGELIDTVAGFDESGNCVTDCPEFSEKHQTSDDATPDELKDEVGGEDTDNAPSGVEGTDSDPVLDLVAGEAGKGGDEFGCSGEGGVSDADKFFDSQDPEEPGTTPGEGPDQNPDPEHIEDMMEAVMGEGCGSSGTETPKKEGADDIGGEEMTMDDLPDDDDASSTPVGESGNGEEYEEGDADLIDMVSGE